MFATKLITTVTHKQEKSVTNGPQSKKGLPSTLVCAVGVCFVFAAERDVCFRVGCVLAVNLV